VAGADRAVAGLAVFGAAAGHDAAVVLAVAGGGGAGLASNALSSLTTLK